MLLNCATSEYKLEFQNLPVEIRKQIWEENLKFRECCAANNRVQHFLNSSPRNGARRLATRAVPTTSSAQEAPAPDPPAAQHSSAQTHSATPKQDSAMQSDMVDSVPAPKVNLPPESTPPTKLKSALKKRDLDLTPSPSTASPMQSCRDVGIQTPQWDPPPCSSRQCESRPKKATSEPCFATNLLYLQSKPSRQSTRNLANLKLEPPQEKKIPFLPYGWNDCKKDIGSKRTFNINASTDEVYPASLHALSRKRELLKSRETLSSKPSRPSTAPLLSPVNHSCLWMPEYQDIFSSDRPRSAPFKTKSARW